MSLPPFILPSLSSSLLPSPFPSCPLSLSLGVHGNIWPRMVDSQPSGDICPSYSCAHTEVAKIWQNSCGHSQNGYDTIDSNTLVVAPGDRDTYGCLISQASALPKMFLVARALRNLIFPPPEFLVNLCDSSSSYSSDSGSFLSSYCTRGVRLSNTKKPNHQGGSL